MFFGLSFPHILVIVSACISVVGATAYIRDTLKGKTKPNRVSWTMWTIAPLIGTAAALSAHADIWPTIRIFLAGFIPLLVLIASFVNPQSYWKLSVFDILCGACSAVALVLWGIVNAPLLAILFAAIADAFASLPTIRKAWTNPETETGLTYVASLTAVVLVLPSIPVWNIENSAFQITLIAVNTLLIFSVYRRRLGIGQLTK